MFLVLAALVPALEARAQSSAPSPGAPAAVLKVALLSPGPVSDAGWNANAYEGLQRIRKELGAEIGHQETKNPSDFEAGFREFGSMGYDLVVGHGFEFQDPALKVAPDFPKTIFIATAGNTVRDNVGGILFELEQATFLCGILAGRLSKSGRIGAVGGMEIPPVKRTIHAFFEGARSVNPKIATSVSYTGSWENIGAAREATLAQIGQGADLIFQNADAAGLGVFQAAKESKGVLAFGSNKDQNGVAPEVILASAALDIPQAFVDLATQVRAGGFKPSVIRYGLKEKVVSLALNPVLASRVSPEIRAEVEAIEDKIVAGAFKVPTGEK